MGEADAEGDVSFHYLMPGWFRGRGGGTELTPPDIAWAWYWEADQGDLLQAPAGSVASADGDPVGFVLHHNAGGDFRQTTSSAKPTLKTGANGINSRPVLRFDGDDYLLDAALAALVDTQGSLVMVAKRTGAAAASTTLWASGDEATATRFVRAGYQIASGVTSFTQQSNDTADQVTGAAADTNAHILVFESNGSAWNFRKDGAADTLTVTSGSNAGDWLGDTADRDNMTIGALVRNTTGVFLTGDIAGMWYSSSKLDAADLDAMEAYLATKYGIALP